MITVTKTYLPPLHEYRKYLNGIWKRNYVTNHGPLVKKLETLLRKYLKVKHLFFVSNGTIGLQLAIKCLNLRGETVTTPFSYVATTSSIVWEGLTPVFADVQPDTLTINPDSIQPLITKKTSAIIAAHVYGNPCDTVAINRIAKKNNLRVIYDAAHAFGVRYEKTPIANFGDISVFSFHATKLFHTVEGGAVATNNSKLAQKIEYMRKFGHKDSEHFLGLGINAKNTELHAAMGLCILPKVPWLINARKKIHLLYNALLVSPYITRPKLQKNTTYNYAYYPIIFESKSILLKVRASLRKAGVDAKRYFFPSLNTLPYIKKQVTPISESVANRILCLPVYYDLTEKDIRRIVAIIQSCL